MVETSEGEVIATENIGVLIVASPMPTETPTPEPTATKTPRPTPPKFELFGLSNDLTVGEIRLKGSGVPNSQVEVLVNGEPVEVVDVDEGGVWQLPVTFDEAGRHARKIYRCVFPFNYWLLISTRAHAVS